MSLDLGGWKKSAADDGYNHLWFDRFSVVHAAWGAAFAAVGLSAPVAIGAQIVFELLENDVKKASKSLWPDWRPDGMENHLGDIAAFSAGYFAARGLARSRVTKGVKNGALIGLGLAGAAIWIQSMAHPPQALAAPAAAALAAPLPTLAFAQGRSR